MPFDVREFTGGSAGDRATSPRAGYVVATWLFSICGMILVMVVLGGVTRLTGSGLSIMEWAPLSGALPPLSQAEWEQMFALYKSVPQYKLVNHGMTLFSFQQIFWTEWIHRLWGRLIGVAFLLPLLWFWATGRIERRLRPRLLVLFLLGGLQGAVGWFMVASGFRPDSTAVAPVRLALHLALALVLYTLILWTALGVLQLRAQGPAPASLLRVFLGVFLGVISLTIVAGSLTAGTHAGFEYNTFPLMDGRLIPQNYARLQPFVRNLTQNLATGTVRSSAAGDPDYSYRRGRGGCRLAPAERGVSSCNGNGRGTTGGAVPAWDRHPIAGRADSLGGPSPGERGAGPDRRHLGVARGACAPSSPRVENRADWLSLDRERRATAPQER